MPADHANSSTTSLYRGKHLELVGQGHWEYATRTVASSAVGIVAIASDQRVVLVEQFRIPANERVIEIPAGLVGDTPELVGEPLLNAAKRELLEETGYESDRWKPLTTGYSSPGLTDEAVTFFLATDAHKTAAGGGDDSESIEVHEIPLDDVDNWLDEKLAAGKAIDFKTLAGLYLAQRHVQGLRPL